MKKAIVIICIIYWTLFSTLGCINRPDNDNTNSGISKYDLQIMYIPYSNRTINVSELSLSNDSKLNVTNNTFSIIIKCLELNKEIEYNIDLQNDYLIPNFDDYTLTPRLNLGFIEENKNYSIDFIFNINSNDPILKSLNFWGILNTVSLKIQYNHNYGLFIDFLSDYKNVSWSYGHNADIIINMPHHQQFGVYLGVLEDY